MKSSSITYADCKKLQALAEHERLTGNAGINFILLPEEVSKGEIRRVQLMGLQPSAPVMKDAEFELPRRGSRHQGLHPPGPPCSKPPDLSDGEGEGNDLHHVLIPAVPDCDGPIEFPKFPPVLPLRQPPDPPSLGPVLPRFNLMDIPVLPLPTAPDPSAAISPAPET